MRTPLRVSAAKMVRTTALKTRPMSDAVYPLQRQAWPDKKCVSLRRHENSLTIKNYPVAWIAVMRKRIPHMRTEHTLVHLTIATSKRQPGDLLRPEQVLLKVDNHMIHLFGPVAFPNPQVIPTKLCWRQGVALSRRDRVSGYESR